MGEATRHDSPACAGRHAAGGLLGRARTCSVRPSSPRGSPAARSGWPAAPAPIDWLLLPAFFVVANFIEWLVHKNPMHRPLPPRILYKNHALIHHRAFLHDSMPINRHRGSWG